MNLEDKELLNRDNVWDLGANDLVSILPPMTVGRDLRLRRDAVSEYLGLYRVVGWSGDDVALVKGTTKWWGEGWYPELADLYVHPGRVRLEGARHES